MIFYEKVRETPSRSAQFFASGEGGDCVHGLFFPDADCLKVHVQESFGAASGGYSLGGMLFLPLSLWGFPFSPKGFSITSG